MMPVSLRGRLFSSFLLVLAVAVIAAVAFGVRIDRMPRLGQPLALAGLSFTAAAVALLWARSRLALEPWHAALALVAVTAADSSSGRSGTTTAETPATASIEKAPGPRARRGFR